MAQFFPRYSQDMQNTLCVKIDSPRAFESTLCSLSLKKNECAKKEKETGPLPSCWALLRVEPDERPFPA